MYYILTHDAPLLLTTQVSLPSDSEEENEEEETEVEKVRRVGKLHTTTTTTTATKEVNFSSNSSLHSYTAL